MRTTAPPGLTGSSPARHTSTIDRILGYLACRDPARGHQAMADSEPNGSRHARFRQIMETAAGAAYADYQGHGKFWNLPLPDLRRFTLYGIPMMSGAAPGPAAPAVQPSCCHEPAGAPASGASDAGLPRGLRGQY